MKQADKKADWVKIGPLPGLPYAQMICEVLAEQDIPYSLTQDGLATAYGFTGTNLAGNKAFIWVPQEFAEQVQQIIERLIDHI
ncbi:MAG: hypothetical protein A2Y94_06370 [Caldithrix sp. RBG_13_44_9]|nr:MAG: hypothetical protein A2Y94_06370 [Caldithrix sp. RBG_13_44_9]